MCVVATIDSIRHTLDAPALEYVPAVQEVHVADELAPVALEYVPATQSVHSEAPAVQAQRQTARSSRDLEIQKDAHSCVYTMHSSLCSPSGTALSCRTHAMDISKSIPSKGPSQIRHIYT